MPSNPIYGQIQGISDPFTRQLLQHLFDQVTALQTQVTTLQGAAVQRTAGTLAVDGRLTGVSAPTADTDGVNRLYVQRYVAGQLAAFAAPAP